MIFEDILYEERDSTAYISINRPQVMNAFRGRTMDELLHAILKAGWDKKNCLNRPFGYRGPRILHWR